MSVTLQQAANNTYLLATGKPSALDLTSTKGLRIVALLNFFLQDWANDSETDWHSLRSIFTVTPTISATDTYSISDLAIGKLSQQEGDYVRIYNLDGSETDCTIVPISHLFNDGERLNSGGNYHRGRLTVAQVGTNLVFSKVFKTTDREFGGTIKLPGQSIPATVSNATDLITIDDPQWLETRAAAEFCRTDVTRVQHYAPLKDQADEKYQDMRESNETQDEEIYVTSFLPGL